MAGVGPKKTFSVGQINLPFLLASHFPAFGGQGDCRCFQRLSCHSLPFHMPLRCGVGGVLRLSVQNSIATRMPYENR